MIKTIVSLAALSCASCFGVNVDISGNSVTLSDHVGFQGRRVEHRIIATKTGPGQVDYKNFINGREIPQTHGFEWNNLYQKVAPEQARLIQNILN